MPKRLPFRLALFLALVPVMACTPEKSNPSERAAAAEPARPTLLRVALAGDVDHFALRFQLGGAGAEFNQLVNAFLTKIDNREDVRPYLLEQLPSQDDGTWVINTDGTMRTTLRLRPGVTWHDGQPVTAQDLAFAYELYRDIEMPNRWVDPERIMASKTSFPCRGICSRIFTTETSRRSSTAPFGTVQSTSARAHTG